MTDSRPMASGRLPDFIGVGAMKCGTTSLHHYLSLHPEIAVSRTKELNFFIGDDAPAVPDGHANWSRGEAWYRSRFPAGAKICGELSPEYCGGAWRVVVAERMRLMVPRARLVLLVREPLARLRSHYLMALGNLDIEPVPFAEFVASPAYDAYLSHSRYGSQLACLLDRFPREQVLVIESEALDLDRGPTLARIFGHLGVDPAFRSPGFRRRLYVGRSRRLPTPLGRRLLGSKPLQLAWNALPFSLYEPLRDLVLVPFTAPPPSFELPAQVRRRLQDELRHEIDLARRLSGEPLASLGP